MIFEQRPSFSSTCRIAMLGVISTWSLRQWFSTHKTAALDVATHVNIRSQIYCQNCLSLFNIFFKTITTDY